MYLKCKNCEQEFIGNYCNNCGQKSSTDKISFRYVQNELFDKFSPIDRGLIFTVRQLIKNPGRTIRNYIEGKRVNFTKPISFILIITGLHLLLEHYKKNEPIIIEFISGLTAVLEKKISTTDSNIVIIILKWLINNYTYTSLLLIPIFSICSLLTFNKSNKNYFENLVLNTYALATITLFTIILFPISYLINDENFDYLQLLLILALSFWIYYTFFDSLKKSSRIINTILTFLLFAIMINIIILFFVFLASIF